MKKHTRHIIYLCLSLLLLLSLPVLSFADAPEKKTTEASWSISENGDLLCYGDERYLSLELSTDYLNLSDFSKKGSVLFGAQELQVGVCADDPNLCILYDESTDIRNGSCTNLFYKEDKIQTAKALLDGDYEKYLFNRDFYISNIETSLIKTLLERLPREGEVIDVTRFANADQYELLGYFKEGLPAKRLGILLDSEQGYYYVSYEGLTNNHFTADGKLSTREGTITALLLNTEDAECLADDLYDHTFMRPTVIMEEELPISILYIFFFVGMASFGIFTPLFILIFAAVTLFRKKTLHPARYAVLALLSILWILLALLITLLILI